MTELPYRPNVSILIVRSDGKFLIVQKKGEIDTLWEFPQGGVEEGESSEQTASREIGEEVNITNFQILGKAKYVHRYDWPEEMQKRKGFRGQEQQIYLVYSKTPQEAKSGEKKILQLKWVTYDEAINQFTRENQKIAAKNVKKEFARICKQKFSLTI